MEPTTLLVVLLIVADIALWVFAIGGGLSATGRFRAYTAAIVLALLLCGSYFGWERTIAASSVIAWLAAIAVANIRPSAAT